MAARRWASAAPISWRVATTLAAADVKSMHSYFARHAVDKEGKAHAWNSSDDPSAGYIAWLLWGGDEGKTWADRHAAKMAD